jgi:N-acetyl-anhydromuramyl-L-alanine amidase AmpD
MFQKRKTTDFLVVHCSATTPSMNWGRAEIDKAHRARGFSAIGYHYVVRRDGTVETGRPVDAVGAHVEGFNGRSVGVCLIGGVASDGKTPENNFTPAQFKALGLTLDHLRQAFPLARIVGHRDLSPDLNRDGRITPNEWLKACPSFDVAAFVKTAGL